MLGLYLHIPFCQSLCSYCNFNRGLFDADLKVRVGFRLYSRLHEMCEFLEYDGGDYRMLPANGGADDLTTLWKKRGQRSLPARAYRSARAEIREPAANREPRDLKWPGGKAGR